MLRVGQIVGGDYEIVRPLREGGMGSVYVVEQRSTGARRALKVMRASFEVDATFRARFEREARIGARIKSEHVVQVHAAGVDADAAMPYLVMELLEGEDLGALVARRGALAVGDALRIFDELGHALAAAHDASVVHRDLKPENVFLARSHRHGAEFTVKVLDFGISKVIAESNAAATEPIGTPLWMAPEQTQDGAPVTPATDVWALGLMAFYVLTGRSYWRTASSDKPSAMALMREIAVEPLVPASERARVLSAPELPEGFDAWFARAVHRDPEARFAHARDAIAALRPLLVNDISSADTALAPRVATGSSVASGTGPGVARTVAPGTVSGRKLIVAAALGFVAVIAFAAVARMVVLGKRRALCESNAPDVVRIEACRLACAAGSKLHCLIQGERMLAQDDPAQRRGALSILTAACAAGVPRACVRQATVLLEGAPGVHRDEAKGIALVAEACAKNDLLGCAIHGDALAWGTRHVRRDITAAVASLTKSCNGGDGDGCALLGVLHFRGQGVPRDDGLASSLFASACEAGSGLGCDSLAWRNQFGKGESHADVKAVLEKARAAYARDCDAGSLSRCLWLGYLQLHRPPVKNPTGAFAAFDRACRLGMLGGCRELAALHRDGVGTPKDPSKALSVAGRACDEDDGDACVLAARMHFEGMGVPKDEPRAYTLFERGAKLLAKECDLGQSIGCRNLADLYLEGLGVPKNATKAAALYETACMQGALGSACARLGDLHAEGVGVPKNVEKAVELWERGCDNRAASSCLQLGRALLLGDPVAKDERRAAMLLQLACDGGSAEGCGDLARLLSSSSDPSTKARGAALRKAACAAGDVASCAADAPPPRPPTPASASASISAPPAYPKAAVMPTATADKPWPGAKPKVDLGAD